MGKKKDFDLDKIDKILAQFPDEGEGGGAGANDRTKPALKPGSPPQQTDASSPPKPTRRRPAIGTWTRVVAGLVLAGAITQWPYGHSCGLGLFLYMAAIGGVLAVGVWAAAHTWQAHLHVPHLLSLAVVLWAMGIGMFQVLPRIGYAKAEAAWLCGTQSGAPAPTITPTAPAQAPQEEAIPPEAAAPADSTIPIDSAISADSSLSADSTPPADSAIVADSIPVAVPDTSGRAGPEGTSPGS